MEVFLKMSFLFGWTNALLFIFVLDSKIGFFTGGASSSILVHGFSWLNGSSRGEIKL